MSEQIPALMQQAMKLSATNGKLEVIRAVLNWAERHGSELSRATLEELFAVLEKTK